ncbi:MAG: ABC transporter ATP-binding protein [Castellaniella sp.]|uniref:ABC transporter ATP-binding protein n=1 Tax=Castellaniella sp. TaxID=1955812 RepID=UPI0012042C17|nr:ABC transporter ATP-binding protein [Castellaniella sp.]TAN30970.1 MAG: ABC transporter ATP-binding protein [Castellaniella sp.]
MSQPILKVENVDQRFSGLHALKRVSFELIEGEILGIIGPNGAGKSTLFNAIVSLVPPVSGAIWFRDRNIVGLPTHRIAELGIAKTSQSVQVFGEMTARDNVAVAALLTAKSVSAARAAAQEELEFWGLEGHADTLAQDLPLAQRSLLELARAMMLHPQVLLVDEVMAGLNEIEVDDILDRLVRINRERGVSLMVIEHNMRALMKISSRILALDYGSVLTVGKPEEVSRHKQVIEAYLGVE